MTKGTLFLIPTYLSDSNDKKFIAPMVTDVIQNIQYYIVENPRTARRFIGSLDLYIKIPECHFEQMDKHFDKHALDEIMQPLQAGHDVGILSESGLPGIADPGNLAVSYAHRHGIKVVSLPGASSIILSLISSGFNGQQFTFHGYLPINKQQRESSIRKLEQDFNKTGYTQLFMETPYRNKHLFKDLLRLLDSKTLLSISQDLCGKQEHIASQTIADWHRQSQELAKLPAMFALGRFPNV